ncbi:hypothetical protein CEXT_736091 [Caerostris extrusa]|uniref:Uncharacterized protein n=1 Tax=Caerostris extrusa TaxID=172846 RepID=A0AAV4MY08_CAEEX|nr:hypothetical protein CEXT_736091 [Caerostris extrusa]
MAKRAKILLINGAPFCVAALSPLKHGREEKGIRLILSGKAGKPKDNPGKGLLGVRTRISELTSAPGLLLAFLVSLSSNSRQHLPQLYESTLFSHIILKDLHFLSRNIFITSN